MKKIFANLLLSGICLSTLGAEVWEDFETLEGWRKSGGVVIRKGQMAAEFEVAPDAAVGKGALKLTAPGTIVKRYKIDPEKRKDWDQKMKGLALRVKGDGSDNWGRIGIGGSGWSYSYYFPLKDPNWRRIVIPWSEFIPNHHMNQKLNSPGALPPSGISSMGLGDKWNITYGNRLVPSFSYCVDQVEFVEDLAEAKVAENAKSQPASFEKVLEKMKKGEEVTVYCHGDSITAGVGVADKNKDRYNAKLQKKLREHFNNDKITVKCRAIGGSRVNHTIAWLERDFADKTPDLITYMIGYNNKSGGHSPELYRKMLNNFIDHVAKKSQGKTAILLITTIPGKNYRFNMQDDFAEVVRDVAKKRGLPYCDVAKEFKKLGREGIAEYMKDTAHPNEKGHKIFADTLSEYIIKKTE